MCVTTTVPVIREYAIGDHDACRACVVQLQDGERLVDPRLRSGESIADAYLQQMHERCREFAGTILVATCNELVVGLVMVLRRVPPDSLDQPPDDYALVAELVVLSEMRGRGIGRALLVAAEDLSRRSGSSELRIGVLHKNRAARQLYLSAGFAPYVETLSKSLAKA